MEPPAPVHVLTTSSSRLGWRFYTPPYKLNPAWGWALVGRRFVFFLVIVTVGSAGGPQEVRAEGRELAQVQTIARPGESWFGAAIAISEDGQTALVGARFRSEAVVLIRVRDTWAVGATLRPSSSPLGGGFGHSVALSGDGNTALVGAPGADAVYAYERRSTGWDAGTKVAASDAGGRFGSSVSLSDAGGDAVVGAPFAGGPDGDGSGAVYFLTSGATEWAVEASFDAAATESQFGGAVAMSGDGLTVVVGAPGSGGAAHVYTREAGAWYERTQLVPGERASRFGASVDVSGDGASVLVGAPSWETDPTRTPGRAFSFSSGMGGEWTAVGVLRGDAWNDYFGTSVALSSDGRVALVGAPRAEARVGYVKGLSYVFDTPSLPFLRSTLEVTSPNSVRYSGTALALAADGTSALLGSHLERTEYGSAGAVYSFEPRSPLGCSCVEGEECASGHCVEGVCCDTACDEYGLTCSAAGGAWMDGECTDLPEPYYDDSPASLFPGAGCGCHLASPRGPGTRWLHLLSAILLLLAIDRRRARRRP
ncbi:MAG: hypothetical protein DRJ42_16155 [Deltaproteobacteria bacterium]|nr:MAG: hypothetical protein DRJ42_16155 [Deltaproteobacteria bacterium]